VRRTFQPAIAQPIRALVASRLFCLDRVHENSR
jgi:hypothetical protein